MAGIVPKPRANNKSTVLKVDSVNAAPDYCFGCLVVYSKMRKKIKLNSDLSCPVYTKGLAYTREKKK